MFKIFHTYLLCTFSGLKFKSEHIIFNVNKNGWISVFSVDGLLTVRKTHSLHGKKEANTLLQQTRPVRGPIHQMFDVKNEIGFVAKQQI